jgi:mono/diheme cytochrome c family protein
MLAAIHCQKETVMARTRVGRRPGPGWALLVLAAVVMGVPGHGTDRAVGAAEAPYRLVEDWPQTPPGQEIGTISGIDVDAAGIAYVFRRCPVLCDHPKEGDPPGVVWRFSASGVFLGAWGQGLIAKEAHTLRVDRSGFIWTTDAIAHQVKKFRPDGTLVMTLGKYGVPGDGPDTFNKPTDVVVAPNGDVFVTDGYGNQRVVKFDKDGTFIKAWGTKGTAPGQFRLPHTIVQDSRGRLIVGDRCGLGATGCTDNRIQIFDTDGKFLDQWTHLGAGALDITTDDVLYVSGNGRISIADARTGKLLDTIEKAGGHQIAVDASGDVYTAGLGSSLRRYTRGATAQSASLALTDQQLRGEGLFLQRCSLCHLPKRMKVCCQAPLAPLLFGKLKVPNPDTERLVRGQIQRGSANMPGFQYSLAPDQIDDVIAYIRTM